MTTSGPELVLFYDRKCPLCRKFVQFIERLDGEGAIEVVDLASPGIEERFKYLDLDAARQNLTVCDRLRKPWHGVEAIRRITKLLPGVRRLTWVYRLPGVTPAVGRVYRSVQRNRQRLCLKCGEKWMPSLKSSVRKRRGRR